MSGYNNAFIVENDENGIYEGIRKCIEKYDRIKETQVENYQDNYEIIKQIEKLVER